jgi:hypothetical protein
MTSDQEYHYERARIEQNLASCASSKVVEHAHLGLSALHIERAKLLMEVKNCFDLVDISQAMSNDPVLKASDQTVTLEEHCIDGVHIFLTRECIAEPFRIIK